MKYHEPALLCCAILLAGCQSPLFVHADAREPLAKPTVAPEEKAADCPLSFPKSGLCASLTWDVAPAEDREGEFTLRFWRRGEATAGGPYLDPANTVFTKLFMPAMGHGSAPITLAHANDASGAALPGIFKGTHASFIMAGTWELWVQLKDGTTVVEQAKDEIKI